MQILSKDTLSDEEQERLDDYLYELEDAKIPNLEALDGFFAALACCPDFIMPSEFLDVIGERFQGDEERVFDDVDEALDFNELVMRHFNHVTDQVANEGPDEIYLPLLLEDDEGKCWGNDWATGFLIGVGLRHEIWREVIESEEHGGSMVPVFALAYEHHEDAAMRPFKEPMSDKKREELWIAAAAGVRRMYLYFKDQRLDYLPEGPEPVVSMKVGRNVPCPCGSGLKFKRCCGGPKTVH